MFLGGLDGWQAENECSYMGFRDCGRNHYRMCPVGFPSAMGGTRTRKDINMIINDDGPQYCGDCGKIIPQGGQIGAVAQFSYTSIVFCVECRDYISDEEMDAIAERSHRSGDTSDGFRADND